MADNTQLNAGTGGDVISTDDIAGVKVQRVKVQHGADGSATDVSTASPLPVTLANTGANATAVKVDGSAVTQPVSAASLPLPTGAATSAKQDTGNTSIASVDTNLGAQADAESTGNGSLIAILKKCRTYLGSLAAQLLDYDTGAGTASTPIIGIALPASGGPVAGGTSTNPVRTDPTGTTAQPVTDNGGSITVDATSLPLPTGAATETTLATLKAAHSVTALQVTASGDTTLLASGTRKLKRIEASNSHATAAVAVGIKVPSLNAGATFGKKYLPAVGGMAVWLFPGGYLQVTAETVTVNLSGAGQVEVTAYYE